MLIGIAAYLFDSAGALMLRVPDDAGDLDRGQRRLAKTATLDGGAVIEDQGYAPADDTLQFALQAPSAAVRATLRHLLRDHALVTVSTPSGVYLAAPESWQGGPSQIHFSMSVLSRISV